MMRTHRFNSSWISVLLAFILMGGGVAWALDQQNRMSNDKAAPASDLLLNANTLIGNTVIDKSGKEMGTVKDFLIDQKSGQIAYIILAYGGTFGGNIGINQENYSIPWKNVTLTRNKEDQSMIVEVAEAPIGESQGTQSASASPKDQEQFNANTMETIEGTIQNVKHEMLNGMQVMTVDVKTASAQEHVRLAPNDYLQKQGMEVEQGDAVKINGSRVTRDGNHLLLASQITTKKNGKALELRQDDGTPKWNQEESINAQSQSRH
ncbi:PRC-barrel domain-containing protein [Candidatus Nitrospira salsa]